MELERAEERRGEVALMEKDEIGIKILAVAAPEGASPPNL